MATCYKEILDILAKKIRTGDYPAGDMLPSLRKLAADFGGSIGTVRKATIELEKMGLVRNVARQGCVVNDLASCNAAKPKNFLVILSKGYLSLDPSLWGTKIFLGIQSECINQGYGVVAKIGNNEDEIKAAIANGLWNNVTGVIGCAPVVHQWVLDEIKSHGIPYILFDTDQPRPIQNHIMTDHFASARLVGKYFVNMGFKNVWIFGQSRFQAAHEALFGLQDAYLDMDQSPASIQFIKVESFTYEVGQAVCSEMLATGEKPNAIFACNDHIAMGALKACQDAGFKVPHDISIVGATGLEKYQLTSPALTVVAQPMEKIGRMCVQDLIKMVTTGQMTNPIRRLAGNLVIRDTFEPSTKLIETLGKCDCIYNNITSK